MGCEWIAGGGGRGGSRGEGGDGGVGGDILLFAFFRSCCSIADVIQVILSTDGE